MKLNIGDGWVLVDPKDFKSSVGCEPSEVGSIPTHSRQTGVML